MTKNCVRTIALLCATAFGIHAQTPPPVPAEYQDLFDSVNANINSFSNTIDAAWDGSKSPVVYSGQLLSANSGMTSGLLAPNYYSHNVIAELNGLQALGVNAITFHLNFPVMYQPFYQNTADYQSYVQFYTQLVSEIKSRGLKVIIENTTGASYVGTDTSSFAPFYQSLDWNGYRAGRSALAVSIAKLLQPDYLVLVAEPDTEASTSGQSDANTVSGASQLVGSMVTAVRGAGVGSNVKLGAGAGTWSASYMQFVQSYLTIPLEFVDMHIYPVNRSFLPNALAAAQLINASGKEVTISEMWAYKMRDSELGVLDYNTVYARDPFSFWSPLDINFLQTMSDFANYQHLTFIDPFWTQELAAYLDYADYAGQPLGQVAAAEGTAATANLAVGSFTPTANAWENMILSSPDRTRPIVPAPPSLKSVSQTLANLTWSPTSDNVGVAAYNLYRNGALVFTSSLTSYSDMSLQPSQTYTYTLSAFDAAGNMSAKSAPLNVTTLKTQDNAAPTTPAGVNATALGDQQINLTWTPSYDNVGVTGYTVYRGTTPTNLTPIAANSTNTYMDPKLQPSTVYYYAVDAYDSFYNRSSMSTPVQAATLADTLPPSMPGSIRASVSGAQVTLNWTDSFDDFRLGSYKIYRGTSPTSMQVIGATTTSILTFVDTTSKSGKTYYYSVAGVDVAKNVSALPAPVTVTIP